MFYQGVKYLCLSFFMVLFLAACSSSEQAAKYLERGKAYYEEGNYDKARVELKNVLQIDPKSIDGHYYLALTLEKKQDLKKAFSHFLAVLELDPKSIPGRLQVGRYYLLAQQNDKAMEMVRSLLADEPGNPEGIALKGAVLARQGDEAGALKQAEKAYQLAPGNRDVVLLLSSLYQKNQADKAAEVLMKGMEKDPDAEILRLKLAEVYWNSKNTEALEKLLHESIDSYPRNALYVTQLAQLYTRLEQLDKAEKVLRDSVAANPEDEDRELVLGTFLQEKRGDKAAETELLRFIDKNPEAYKVRFGLAKLYKKNNKPKQAEQLYVDIIKIRGTNLEGLQAKNELAILRLDNGQHTDSKQLVTDVLENNPNDPQALMTRGRIALQQGDAKGAINDFRTILLGDPASDSILVLLASAHMRNSEPELARESLRKAIKVNPRAFKARYALISFLTSQKKYDDALRQAAELLKLAPDDRRGLLTVADIHAFKGNWKQAEQAAQKIKQNYPENSAGNIKLGQLYAAQKRYDEAISELEIAIKKSPEQAAPVIALTKTYVAKGKPDNAISLLLQQIKKSPANQGGYYNLLGELYLLRQQEQQAINAFQNSISSSSKKSWNAAVKNLANIYLKQGNKDEAVKLVRDAVEKEPGNSVSMLFLAGIYERTADYDYAIQLYREMLKVNPGSDVASNNLASLLTDFKGDAASLQQALKLAGHFKNSPNPAYIDTLGWAYYKSGDTGKALALLKKAVQKAPKVTIFNYHLGVVYSAAGDKALAREHLGAVLAAEDGLQYADEAKKILDSL